MAKRRPWWQWGLVAIAIVVGAWWNVHVWTPLIQAWTSPPSMIDAVDQAVEELQRAIDREGR